MHVFHAGVCYGVLNLCVGDSGIYGLGFREWLQGLGCSYWIGMMFWWFETPSQTPKTITKEFGGWCGLQAFEVSGGY